MNHPASIICVSYKKYDASIIHPASININNKQIGGKCKECHYIKKYKKYKYKYLKLKIIKE